MAVDGKPVPGNLLALNDDGEDPGADRTKGQRLSVNPADRRPGGRRSLRDRQAHLGEGAVAGRRFTADARLMLLHVLSR